MLVRVRAETIIDIIVGDEFVVCANVVIDSLIGVPTAKLTDVFNDVCANILIEVGLSDGDIIVLGAAVIALEFAVSVS